MRAVISLCAVLLLAAVGCSKTDDSADRSTAPMDQSTPSTTPDDTATMPPSDTTGTAPDTTMPPDQTTPPTTTDETTPPPPEQ